MQGARALLARSPARAARAHGQLRTTSTIRIARSIRRSKRRSSTRSPISPRSSRSTRACARRSGASTTRPRSRKPRSNTSTKVSPSVYVRFTANDEQREAILEAFGCAAQPEGQDAIDVTVSRSKGSCQSRAHLDDDAVDAAGQRRDRAARRRDATASIASTTRCDRRRRARAQGTRRAIRAMRRCSAARAANELDELAVRHPFMDRDSVIVLADYVDLETGTGAVHTAPGHGADDFETGVKYGLPILNPVDAAGHFTAEAGPYAGMQHLQGQREDRRRSARERRALERRRVRAFVSALLALPQSGDLPRDRAVVHRDGSEPLRQRAIDATDGVEYTPEWGRARQRQMIETHPEWCISRQRTWGTPIPRWSVCNAASRSSIRASRASRPNALARSARARGGAIRWRCICRPTSSARTAAARVRKREEHRRHLVRIGRDAPRRSRTRRHAVAVRPRSRRRRSVPRLVPQFAADRRRDQGTRALSPRRQERLGERRARPPDVEVARHRHRRRRRDGEVGRRRAALWAASVELIDDVRFGPNVVEQVGRVYRNLRNRIRFMISNLDDFAADDVVARDAMEPLDRLACSVTDAFVANVKRAYDAIRDSRRVSAHRRVRERDVEPVFRRAEGSAVLARRTDPRRRSAQSALLYVLTRFLTALAPVLSFTAEEAWQALPADAARRCGERLRYARSTRAANATPRGERSAALGAPARAARARRGVGEPARLRGALR